VQIDVAIEDEAHDLSLGLEDLDPRGTTTGPTTLR
jgi:hypothetical protein